MTTPSPRRIGIYAGTFDPVHSGHLSFAIQTMREAGLDQLYFLAERRPRYKQAVEHYAHRVAMLKKAIRPYPYFSVLDFTEPCFSVAKTLPKLEKQFSGDRLVFLVGSDTARHLPLWPKADRLLTSTEVVVGVRQGDSVQRIEAWLQSWQTAPLAYWVFPSFAPDISSGKIREALRTQTHTRGLLHSVAAYSRLHWLYVSLS